MIGVEFGRAARDLLEGGGIEVTYRETHVAHQIDPATLRLVPAWIAATLKL